jgi:hypothetical protein
MELQLQNRLQAQIADLLWEAQTLEEVDRIVRVFGHDARVVYNMMTAASFDNVTDTDLAKQALANLGK